MPIYEYECLTCSTKFEALRSMKDADAEIACKWIMERGMSGRTSTVKATSRLFSRGGWNACRMNRLMVKVDVSVPGTP